MPEYNSRAALVTAMRAQITSSDAQAIKALTRIHEYQTAAEQRTQSTHCFNGEGFNRSDARILSSMCDFYKRKGFLSQKQMAVVKARIGKYAGQLVEISVKKGLIKKIGDKYAYGVEADKLNREAAVAAKKRQIMEEATKGF